MGWLFQNVEELRGQGVDNDTQRTQIKKNKKTLREQPWDRFQALARRTLWEKSS